MSQYLNDIANQSQMLQTSSSGGNANLVDVLPTEKYDYATHKGRIMLRD